MNLGPSIKVPDFTLMPPGTYAVVAPTFDRAHLYYSKCLAELKRAGKKFVIYGDKFRLLIKMGKYVNDGEKDLFVGDGLHVHFLYASHPSHVLNRTYNGIYFDNAIAVELRKIICPAQEFAWKLNPSSSTPKSPPSLITRAWAKIRAFVKAFFPWTKTTRSG